jgi:hypothetical protein
MDDIIFDASVEIYLVITLQRYCPTLTLWSYHENVLSSSRVITRQPMSLYLASRATGASLTDVLAAVQIATLPARRRQEMASAPADNRARTR